MTDGAWLFVAPSRDFRSGRPRGFVVAGRPVAVLKLGDAWHAFSNRCPHNGLALEDGGLDGHVLTCRWHGWRFDITTGLSPDVPEGAEGPRIRVYAVRVVDGRVEVTVPPIA
ncbi:MAG TPA: Rieske 2Fe-2S domain-containing protein [Candidatus Eisenbacteria bacterium]